MAIYRYSSELHYTSKLYHTGIRFIALSSVQHKQCQGVPREGAAKLFILLDQAKVIQALANSFFCYFFTLVKAFLKVKKLMALFS